MTRISPQTIKGTTPLTTTEPGFSLIELMVVVGVLALFAILAIPTIAGYFRVTLNSATRDLATTIKETYNTTLITGRVHRMAYDFKKSEYWVENGPPGALLDTEVTRKRDEDKKRFMKETDLPSPTFALAKAVTPKKHALPMGVSFEDVMTEQSKDAITDGIAYSHFFPNGLIEQTLIHLKDESKHHISLVLLPLVGKTDLYERYINREEAFGK